MKKKVTIFLVTGMLFVMFFTAFLTANTQLAGEHCPLCGKWGQTSTSIDVLAGDGPGCLDCAVW